jgi:Ras homolog gene family, member A
MCFSVDRRDSYTNIKEKWTPEVIHFCPLVPRILVGNKIDLRDDEATKLELSKNNQEPLLPEQGHRMAEKIGAVAYLECSAKTKEGVREVFEFATRTALETTKRNAKKRLCVIL